MDLIDRDELELDTEWSDYYDGFTSYSQSQINGAVEVQAIPLDRIKSLRDDAIEYRDDEENDFVDFEVGAINGVIDLIDKLIAESEEKDNED